MNRDYRFDLLKIIAAIAVIFIHTANMLSNTITDKNIIFNFAMYGTKFAVPLFLIISGYFYYGSKNKVVHIKNNTILYIFMNFLFAFITFFMNILGFASFEFITIFWYFRTLAQLQILTLYQNKIYIIILLIFLLFIRTTNIFNKNDYNVLVYGIPFLLGAIIKMIHINKNNILSFIFLIFSITIILFNTVYFQKGQWNIINTISAFSIFMTIYLNKHNFTNKKIYKYSLSFYLFHMIFISIITYILKIYPIVKFYLNWNFVIIIFVILNIIILYKFSYKLYIFIKKILNI